MRVSTVFLVLSLGAVAFAAPAQEQHHDFLAGIKEAVHQTLEQGRAFVEKELAQARAFGAERVGELKQNLKKAEQVLNEKVAEAHSFLDSLAKQASQQADQAKEQAQEFLKNARAQLESLKDQLKNFGQKEEQKHEEHEEHERSKRSVEWLEQIKAQVGKAINEGRQFVEREIAAARAFGADKVGELKENLKKAEQVLNEKVAQAHEILDTVTKQASEQADHAKAQAHEFLQNAKSQLESLKDQLKSFGKKEEKNHEDHEEHARDKRSVAWLDEIKAQIAKHLKEGKEFVQKELEAAQKFGADEAVVMKDNLKKAEQVLKAKIAEAHKVIEQVAHEAKGKASEAADEARKIIQHAKEQLESLKDQLTHFGSEDNKSVNEHQDHEARLVKRSIISDLGQQAHAAMAGLGNNMRGSMKRWASLGARITAWMHARAASDKSAAAKMMGSAPQAVRDEVSKLFKQIKSGDFNAASKSARDDLMGVVRDFYRQAMAHGTEAGKSIDEFGAEFRSNVAADLEEGQQSWDKVHAQLQKNGAAWGKQLGVDAA